MSQLDQLLKFLTESLQQGKDFAVDQAPQFVRELLLWRFYQCEIWIGVGVFLLILGLLVGQLLAGFNDDPSDRRLARWMPSLGGFVLCFIFVAANTWDMVQIKVAPRVVLVQMVRDLIAGAPR